MVRVKSSGRGAPEAEMVKTGIDAGSFEEPG